MADDARHTTTNACQLAAGRRDDQAAAAPAAPAARPRQTDTTLPSCGTMRYSQPSRRDTAALATHGHPSRPQRPHSRADRGTVVGRHGGQRHGVRARGTACALACAVGIRARAALTAHRAADMGRALPWRRGNVPVETVAAPSLLLSTRVAHAQLRTTHTPTRALWCLLRIPAAVCYCVVHVAACAKA